MPVTRLVCTLVALISATACDDSAGQPESRRNVEKLLAQADTRNQELKVLYRDSHLSGIEAYRQAQLSYQHAFELVEANNINHAIPHARSAVAQLEEARLDVTQREFVRLRSSILKQQLSLIKLDIADNLVEGAEKNFRQALQDYQFRKFESALRKMNAAHSQYELVLQSR